jgi:hypothetical protein
MTTEANRETLLSHGRPRRPKGLWLPRHVRNEAQELHPLPSCRLACRRRLRDPGRTGRMRRATREIGPPTGGPSPWKRNEACSYALG